MHETFQGIMEVKHRGLIMIFISYILIKLVRDEKRK